MTGCSRATVAKIAKPVCHEIASPKTSTPAQYGGTPPHRHADRGYCTLSDRQNWRITIRNEFQQLLIYAS
jgi:hypothetical protein